LRPKYVSASAAGGVVSRGNLGRKRNYGLYL